MAPGLSDGIRTRQFIDTTNPLPLIPTGGTGKNLRDIIQYISTGHRPDITRPGRKRKGTPRQPDPLKRLKVEQAAITCVCDYYTKEGDTIQSVETDNVGWDLTAADDEITLKLEVKPRLQIFSYSVEMNAWSDSGGVILQFSKKTSARIFT